MFNFLVTARTGAWDLPGYEYPRGRFLEYTTKSIAERFQELKTRQINVLKNLPCLFAYEGKDQPVHIGRIQKLELRDGGRSLFIRPEIDRTIQPIPFGRIAPLQIALDIRDWELSRTHWAIKSEDLFEVLTSGGVLRQDQPVSSFSAQNLPDAPNPTLEARSVNDFISIVLGLDSDGRQVFYRGHSDRRKYRLEPSIFRKDDSGNFLYRNAEDQMYRELLVSNSVDFHGDVYTLDRLVRMQHYSLPTRLLDITSNSLIALYFACRSNSEIEGEVIILSVNSDDIKYFDSDTASCIANLTRLTQQAKDAIDYTSVDVRNFNKQKPVKQLLHFIREEKPFFDAKMNPRHLQSVLCVKGKHSNNRITFQSGAFLLFGHDSTIDENGTQNVGVKRISISNKLAMLKQLDQLNINESTVFPYIESSARYIADKFKFKPPPAS